MMMQAKPLSVKTVTLRPSIRAVPRTQCRALHVLADEMPIYMTMAGMISAFGLTFGVAPRYKSAFKESETWKEMYTKLMDMGGVESVEPRQAQLEAQNGALLMDVRLSRNFENGAIELSRNFPLYQPISGWGVVPNVRRLGFAFFGVFGTERNLQWLAEVEAAVPKSQTIIVACELGGHLDVKPGVQAGFQSQSLKAAYFLKQAGYNVLHLKGGVEAYSRERGLLTCVGDECYPDEGAIAL